MASLVTIIIPVYNGVNTIEKCILSAVNQTYKNIEIIVVNDGSTDGTDKVLDKYVKLDDRVMVYNKTNGGQSSARNLGLQNARGEYVLFLDSDDYLEKNALEVTTKSLIHSNASFCLFGFNIYKQDKLLRKPNPGDDYYINKSLNYNDFIKIESLINSPCNKLYRRSYLKELFCESMVYSEDELFNYMNLFKGIEISWIHDCLYNVQLNINSVNTRYKKGRLLDTLNTAEIKENKLVELFEDNFILKNHYITVLSSLELANEYCANRMSLKNFSCEMKSVEENLYYLKLLKELSICKIHIRVPLFFYYHKLYFLQYYLSKFMYLIRKKRDRKRR